MKRILLVHGGNGPPISYVLPRVRRHGEIYVYLAARPNAVARQLLDQYATAYVNPDAGAQLEVGNTELRESLVAVGRSLKPDAIVTFDEFRLVPVSEAAIALGLRGVGPNVWLTRDKWKMRQAFAAAGAPSPRHALVRDEVSLARASAELGFPFIMKATGGAGSLGHSIVRSHSEGIAHWYGARATLRTFADANTFHSPEEFREPAFVAEQIIPGTTRSWYPDDSGYGDYVSVEGLVANGRYYPYGITTRLPTIHPFTEVGNQTPCTLSEELQLRIADTARAAVDAMRSEFCGTHTEIKFTDNNGLCVVETAARLAGCTNIPQLERVYGADMVDVLMELLLAGGSDRLPSKMHVGRTDIAAGTLALLPTDTRGVPWDTQPRFHADVDWSRLVSPDTLVEVDWAKTVMEGSRIAPYDNYKGLFNAFGMLYLESRTPESLMRDQYRIISGLRHELERLDSVAVGAV